MESFPFILITIRIDLHLAFIIIILKAMQEPILLIKIADILMVDQEDTLLDIDFVLMVALAENHLGINFKLVVELEGIHSRTDFGLEAMLVEILIRIDLLLIAIIITTIHLTNPLMVILLVSIVMGHLTFAVIIVELHLMFFTGLTYYFGYSMLNHSFRR